MHINFDYMLMRKHLEIFLFTIVCTLSLHAQESASFRQQAISSLPVRMQDIFVLDGRLFCYADNMLFEARFSAGTMVSLSADTMLYPFSSEADYAVRNPLTGNVFFTERDSRDRHTLFEVVPREGKSPKVRKVRLGRRLSIDHPVFSSDGTVLVFASIPSDGFGGSDLFYCRRDEDGDWTTPRSLGAQINTSGDEVNPVLYGDYLYYAVLDTAASSRCRLVAARLLQTVKENDTVSRIEIVNSAPIELPNPYNVSRGATSNIAFDTAAHRIFLLSNRDGAPSVYLYDGSMPTVVLSGTITDVSARPLPYVNVSVFLNDRLACRSMSDEHGQYRFLLGCGETYTLWMSKAGYFGNTVEVTAVPDDANHAVAELENNVTLDNLELGKNIYLFDIFGPDASVELSQQGKQRLQRMVRFLYENPQIRASIGVSSQVTSDNEFNSMVTERRIENLQRYLSAQLPNTTMEIFIAPTGTAKDSYNSRLSIRME